MIQQKLENFAQNSSDFVPALVAALKPQFADVMSNQFGNYLCQKIIEVSSVSELAQIVDAVLPTAISISLSVHGTRAMQSLVEMIAQNTPSLHEECQCLIRELDTDILQMSTHVNGNHVIQAFLTSFKCGEHPADQDCADVLARQQYTQFIFQACQDHCEEIGTHKHGCCVMQRCLEKGSWA